MKISSLENISLSIWAMIVPALLLGSMTIFLMYIGMIPLYYLGYTFVMWVLACGLGIAVGYHRVFSHKTHKLPVWKENVIMFFAVFAGQGASIFWTALHRGYHHPYSDTDKDLHSPGVHGVYEAFVGWYFKVTESSNLVNPKYAVDLLKKPNHVWFAKNHIKILWMTPIMIALIDWKLALSAFWLVTMIGVLQDNLVNVFGHLRCGIGYRNFETRDNSQNNFILGYLAWGQGWHNNHHHSPGAYDFGSGVSGKWWEFDPAVIFKWFLK